MCGIVGFFGKVNGHSNQWEQAVREACKLQHHRGPDDSGVHIFEKGALGHVRLSILDLSQAGHQPMVTPDKRYVISYNGEVYNFIELRKELTGLGVVFDSGTDTEVILKGFQAWGEGLFLKLNGMFAFSIVDTKEQKMWLVRDRFGIKPLYYYSQNDVLAFSSEIKGIFSTEVATPSIEFSMLTEFSYYGNNLGEKTLFEGIKKVLPGHFLYIDLRTLSVSSKKYWSIASVEQRPFSTDSVEKVGSLLDAAVKSQLVSDVPVGIFLSGGIDSSAITAFASQHYGGKLNTYSVEFDYEKGVNELSKARMIAEKFGTEHHEIHIAGSDVADVVVKMVEHHDLPFSDAANIPLYLLCSEVNKKGDAKVILQGDGGDEFFGGYQRHATLSTSHIWRKFAPLAATLQKRMPRMSQYYRIRRFLGALSCRDDADLMALLLTEEGKDDNPQRIFSNDLLKEKSQSDPFKRFREKNAEFDQYDLLQKMLYTDTQIVLPDIFLEKVDRSTMAASVEVRVPFLDNDLSEYVLGLPSKCKVSRANKKMLLKQALHEIIPHEILYGPKTGFGVPIGYWIKGSLKDLLFDTMSDLRVKKSKILNYEHIEALHRAHSVGERQHGVLLWKALNFSLWLKKFELA
ncbi:MAG: asparagine synthase (glutamine-hydrolyzing) [Aliivibrio sp.]|uniref:asparagine synthase (glutamine-hydrolyzing) n=1 Tax=Aliivibrio sp. TaxID=1872443 RepID=UPI001A5B7F18|nr:asparagine synthase (glutamine-hydrolyzing) [Aliivibrio sp.]